MRQLGKKGRAWVKDRAGLIKQAILDRRIKVEGGLIVGVCEECKWWKSLDPDHIVKRSQGGGNETGNIRWICRECHNKADNMPDSKKQKGKKAEWASNHKCFLCKKTTHLLLCEHCGRLSVKR